MKNNFIGSQPYFIYKRIQLTSVKAFFLHPIDYGFDYLLRNIIVKYPEVDSTGANYGPKLRFESVETSASRRVQNVPIPFELVTTPGSAGVQINAALQMTATGPNAKKMINVVHPYRDNIHIEITGQNGTLPVIVDIVTVGYLIPNKNLSMWGDDGGTN